MHHLLCLTTLDLPALVALNALRFDAGVSGDLLGSGDYGTHMTSSVPALSQVTHLHAS